VREAVVLRRLDPDTGAARFYSLVVERDLLGHVVLVRPMADRTTKILLAYRGRALGEYLGFAVPPGRGGGSEP
jgi:hypothetical protein